MAMAPAAMCGEENIGFQIQVETFARVDFGRSNLLYMKGMGISSWLKWLLAVAVLGGAVIGGLAYVRRPKDEAPELKTSPVALGEITQSVTANGALNAVRTVTVGSQISGTIT